MILAGGASLRFGSDKAFATWEGETFLARVGQALRPACSELLLIGRSDVPPERYQAEVPGARVLQDVHSRGGPVVALRDALTLLRAPTVLVAPCDAPALTAKDVQTLIEGARKAKRPAVATAGPDVFWDLFCLTREALDSRLGAARRLEDLLADAAHVPLEPRAGLNVNLPASTD